jgi:Fe-S-cluster containining protein
MKRERIYFTWPDRGLSYECRGCGACCKGLGIGLDAASGQVESLTGHYPELIPFLRKRGDTWTAFNPRGQCWFIDGEGLCRIEVDHGRETKPASCRLFPFNRIFRIGSWTIVDYNSVICPLQAATAGDGIAHDDVVADIEAVKDKTVVGTQLPASNPGGEGRRFVMRERAIATACFASDASVDSVWKAQTEESLDDARALLSAAADAVLGNGLRAPSGATLRDALLLTPSMRFNELYGPRQYDTRDHVADMLARVHLAWLHFVAVGAELAARDLSLQESTTIWSEQMALVYVMAHWDCVPALEPGPQTIETDVARTVATAAVDGAKRETTGQILEPALSGMSAPDRVIAVKSLEPMLRAVTFGRVTRP